LLQLWWIGFEICEDAWVANRPGAALALKATDIILNPSASHFAFGKLEVRKRFVLEGSRAFSTSYVYANLLGNEAGRAIYDGGALIATGGKLVAAGPRFSFEEVQITTAVVDVDATRMSQARTASFRPQLGGNNSLVVRTAFDFPATMVEPVNVQYAEWETSQHLKEEEFTRAEALALFDYLRKSRSQGFVVSLSGGADSAACVCLVHLMCALGRRELGAEKFAGRLCYLRKLTPGDARGLTKQLLTTAYQASENSGETTRNAARLVADAVGAEHLDWSIGNLVRDYVRTIEQATATKLNWQEHDIPLQNIQARVRSPGSRSRLRDHGRRHQRRPQPAGGHRQGLATRVAELARNRWTEWAARHPGAERHQSTNADGGTPSG
jgi:NAD+ synthase (glutamine-hydrolysing)